MNTQDFTTRPKQRTSSGDRRRRNAGPRMWDPPDPPGSDYLGHTRRLAIARNSILSQPDHLQALDRDAAEMNRLTMYWLVKANGADTGDAYDNMSHFHAEATAAEERYLEEYDNWQSKLEYLKDPHSECDCNGVTEPCLYCRTLAEVRG